MDKLFLFMILAIAGMVVVSAYTFQNSEAFSLVSMTPDKEVYHSSEVMKLSVIMNSAIYLENVTVSASGINGKFNQARSLNLSKGDNEIVFEYILPRCNVCGGIAAGDYNLTCTVSYKNITIEESTTINIQQ